MFSFLSNLITGKTACNDIIAKWGNKPIASCVLGISQVGMNSKLSFNISHSSLLLLNKEIDYEIEDELQKEIGILIEYGDYSPNMCKDEQNNVNKGYVIYRYGDRGGLRYYGKKYSEFITELGEIGYIDLNIDDNNKLTFKNFINKIAPLEDNKWIKENYSMGITNNFNSSTFVIHALKELKPHFSFVNVCPSIRDLIISKNIEKKLNFIPSDIKTELMNYYKKC